MATNSLRRNTAFNLPFAPATRLEANRWLNYATFGASTKRVDLTTATKTAITYLAGEEDDADKLMRIGYSAYVTEQFADNSIPNIYSNINFQNLGESLNTEGNSAFLAWFYAQGLHGSAQIRLKLAYALSQIFALNSSRAGAAPELFYELFLEATKPLNNSSFRVLMGKITRSPNMGQWLTYYGSKKTNIAANVRPDQNYARERMQLFTIGLVVLNLDGTPVLDANGNTIPTYLPNHIFTEADVFTGFSQTFSGSVYGARNYAVGDLAAPEDERDHEIQAKTLFPYPNGATYTIPAMIAGCNRLNTFHPQNGYIVSGVTANAFTITGLEPSQFNALGLPFVYRVSPDFTTTRVQATVDFPNGTTTATINKTAHGLTNGTAIWAYGNIQESIEQSENWLFNHPNVPPFVSTALIKLLVTSNPTPGYVKRVATVFLNNGNGVRGDIASVVKAIFLDREAILPYGINPNNHGKSSTILDRQLRVARAMRSDIFHINLDLLTTRTDRINVVPTGVSAPWNSRFYFTKPINLYEYNSCSWLNGGSFMPFAPRSVFNHFDATYSPVNTPIGDIKKLAPELQINSISTQAVWANQVASMCEVIPSGPNYGNNTIIQSYGDGGGLDCTGNGQMMGFDFNPSPAGWTVTSVSGNNVTVSGFKVDNSSNPTGTYTPSRNRTNGNIYFHYVDMAVGTGSKSLTALTFNYNGYTLATPAVGDIIDFVPLAMLSFGGFPTRVGSIGIAIGLREYQPCQVIFHKVASFLQGVANTAATPTDADLKPAVDYLESILFTRPLSAQGRALAYAQGKVTATSDSAYYNGDATFNNNWRHLQMDFAQRRARRMTAILLVLPEFLTQR